MKVLSCFSGIGMYDLASEMAGMKVVAQIEIDPFCRAVLRKHWPDVLRGKDIRNVKAETILRKAGKIDLIIGGSPCQNISVSGKKEGMEEGSGTESSLFWEMFRLIQQTRPRWVVIENSPRLRTAGFDTMADSLEKEGYTIWPFIFGPWAYKAPHERQRAYVVAFRQPEALGDRCRIACRQEWELSFSHYAETFSQAYGEDGAKKHYRSGEVAGVDRRKEMLADGGAESVVERTRPLRQKEKVNTPDRVRKGNDQELEYAQSQRLERLRKRLFRWPSRPGVAQAEWEAPRVIFKRKDRHPPKPTLLCPNYGHSKRMDRSEMIQWIKAAGNCNPPQVMYSLLKAIMRIDKMMRKYGEY